MLYSVHKKLGFTVVELIVVIVVIGILASIGLVVFRGVQDRAYTAERLNEGTQYLSMFKLYATQERKYPSVPRAGIYCLGTNFASSSYVSSLGGDTSLPSTLLGQAANYCHELLSHPGEDLNATYPPLNTALSTVGSLSNNRTVDKRSAKNRIVVGPYVRYEPGSSPNTASIYVYIIVDTACPKGLRDVFTWPNGSKGCELKPLPEMPVTYTNEPWNYAGP